MPRVAVVTCGVIEEEIRHFAEGLEHVVHIEVIEQGLHNVPDRLRSRLGDVVHRVEDTTDAEVIVLGYGLCSRGTQGVSTRRCGLVMPRAHDCITLLLGNKERYAQYVADHPGTYWYSPGWNKCHTPPGEARYNQLLNDYTEKYGQENAEYLMEQEQNWFEIYNQATYVDLTVGATQKDLKFTQECADWLGWSFDRQRGDTGLVKRLLSGPWNDEEFVVLEPGERFRFVPDHRVIALDDEAG